MAKSEKVAQGSDYAVILQKAADLVPYARNTRKHSDEQIAALMGSLIEFGVSQPVLVQGTGIVAGHGITLAALRLYEQGQTLRTPSGKDLPKGYLPTLDCTGWSDAKKRAYIIADNALALRSDWDTELLKVEIGQLESENYNVDMLGFDPDELSQMLYPGAGRSEPGSGSAETVPDGYVEQFAVIVVCSDAGHQEQVFEKLQAEGYNVKVVVT